MNKFKNAVLVSGGTIAGIACSALPAFAEGTVDTAVTGAITTISQDSVATLAAIAPIAITIFGAIFVWKVGKKVFNIISK